MPKKTEQKKAQVNRTEAKLPAPGLSALRVKKSDPVAADTKGAASAANEKPASSKPASAKAKTTATTATDSLLQLNGAVNGEVSGALIAERAYFLWLEKGCPEGTADQDWMEAERELALH